jgi:hypothetical protein
MQKRNWSEYDEKLIYRRKIIFDMEFFDRYELKLTELNKNKEGSPYKFTNSYILFVGIARNTFSMPYRQLEGFTIGLHDLIFAFSTADYSGLRKRIVKLSLLSYLPIDPDDGPITIAVDFTGIKVHKSEIISRESMENVKST